MSERRVGTVSRGIRCPIFREGDDLAQMVVDSVLAAAESEDGFEIRDRDVVCITESVVARCQGNYATVDDIAEDVRAKFGNETIGIVWPILSRNRFSILLRGFAKGAKKVVVMLSYPSDEVGNALVSPERFYESGIDPYATVLNEEEFRKTFGEVKHQFTGVDYIEFYRDLIEGMGAEAEIIFSNRAETILDYTKNVINCDIHTRFMTRDRLKKLGANVYGLDQILTSSVNGSGFNEKYGLLGTNKATEDTVKLFPRDGQPLVDGIQKLILDKTGKCVEVMVYGDGAFKDPAGKIWELADPVVSPFYTAGLEGTPNEVKLKYLADNDFAELTGEALRDAIKQAIIDKPKESMIGNMVSEGTTPRRLTDLIGSLCDLTSGSGDKGTPVVYIQGYFDNYTSGR
ncbi:MAG: F420-0--gamma-glutamyl ligase [Clostridiales bacterium]|nr:F420-0--gamma-glutamyl ligase [Clostridiales bacterium]